MPTLPEPPAPNAAAPSASTFDRFVAGLEALDQGPGLAHAAWESARLFFAHDDARHDAGAVILLAAAVAHAQGHTFLPMPAAVGAPPEGPATSYTRALLESLAGDPALAGAAFALLRDEKRGALAGLLGRPGDRSPLVAVGDRLYLERVERVEARLTERLARRLHAEPPAWATPGAVERALAAVLAAPPHVQEHTITLSDQQAHAIRTALTGPLALVTGGPGTGKTSVVLAILRTALRLGIESDRIALATPTGKAGQRLLQAIDQVRPGLPRGDAADDELARAPLRPSTLHRLLGYLPARGQFRHHRQNPIAADLVLVDEASMIDLALMERLLDALPAHAALVLIGDPDQLPSVQAGAVFRDLATLLSQHVAHLEHSYRVTGDARAGLLEVARLVRAGDHTRLLGAGRDGSSALSQKRRCEALDFEGVELLSPPSPERHEALLTRFLEHWLARAVEGGDAGLAHLRERSYEVGASSLPAAQRADLAQLFAHTERSRLLAVTRSLARPTGAASLNARLHALVLRRQESRGLSFRAPAFLPGEPVIVARNDYDLGLWNGDQGIVIRGEDPRRGLHLAVAFVSSDDTRVFPLELLAGNLELGYAMTVHRAQGSEYDRIALVLPVGDLALLSRQLVYTAITRSRRGAVIVGTADTLRDGVRRLVERLSGLKERLQDAG